MSRKVRIDRWDADLTEEQRWAAYDKAHGTPWYLWAQWVREQYGAEVSRAGYYRWMASMREGASNRRLEQAAIAIAEAGKLADRAGNGDKILAGAYKALAADAAMSSGDAETAQRYVQMAMAIEDRVRGKYELELKEAAQKTRDEMLRLAREKFEAAEKRNNAVKATVTDSSLSPEEREQRIREIFGL